MLLIEELDVDDKLDELELLVDDNELDELDDVED